MNEDRTKTQLPEAFHAVAICMSEQETSAIDGDPRESPSTVLPTV